jgi:hypothetical protein
MAGWFSRLLPRIKRWWHCLLGTFGKHRMIDTSTITYSPGGSEHYEIVWIGCECGETFWDGNIS